MAECSLGMALLLFVPYVGQIAWALVLSGVVVRFGHGTAVALGTFFLPFVFLPWLGLGPSRYRPPRIPWIIQRRPDAPARARVS